MLLTSWLRALPSAVSRTARRRAALKNRIRSCQGVTATFATTVGPAESLEVRALLTGASPDSFMVDVLTDVDDNNVTAGNLSLREAVRLANADANASKITFAASLTSGGAGTITLDGTQLLISTDVTITGPGADLLAIDGNSKSRVIEITAAGTADLSGLTIQNGLVDFSTVEGRDGGGIFNSGKLTVGQSVVSKNQAVSGGGIFSGANSTLTIQDSEFSGNTSSLDGGGIQAKGAVVTISNSTIADNTSKNHGGGVSTSNASTLTIRNSAVSGNMSRNGGGGLYNYDKSTTTVINSTISGNRTTSVGGGISNYNSATLNLLNSTVTENHALDSFTGPTLPTGVGGGISASFSAIAITITNSIVTNNYSGPGTTTREDITGDADTALQANFSIIGQVFETTLTGANNLRDVDPMLGPLTDNGGATKTHALLTGSPAIDAGDSVAGAAAGDFDQRGDGFVRVFGDSIDIGAFEVSPSAADSFEVTNLDDEDDTNTSNLADLSLREALRLANANSNASTITFAASLTSNGAATITLGGTQLTISSNVTLKGPGANLLVIDANKSSRVLLVDDGNESNSATASIFDLTITGGMAANADANLGYGGGILNRETLTITGTTVRGNLSNQRGGGIYNAGTGKLTVSNSTISSNNSGTNGGGISNYEGMLTVLNSTISGNTAKFYGGGLAESYGTTVLRNVTITGNSVEVFSGGGIGIEEDGVEMHNTIVIGNLSPEVGGDIFDPLGRANGGVSDASSNNIVGDPEGFNAFTNGVNGNIVGDSTGDILAAATVLSSELADNGGPTLTHALIAGSPAIDAGDTVAGAAAGDFDQRGDGFVRVSGDSIDIGAFEFSMTISPPDSYIASLDGSNNLVIDEIGGGTNDDLTLSYDGTNIALTLAGGGTIGAGGVAGLSGGGTSTLTINLTQFAGSQLIINAGAGNDVINVGALLSGFTKSLVINGGTGDDTVNFNGDITFAADQGLDVDLQNDAASPGVDVIFFNNDANVVLSGTGAAKLTASKFIGLAAGSSLVTENGSLTLAANRQATPTSGNFVGVAVDGSLVEVTGSGALNVSGRGGDGDGASIQQYGISVAHGGIIRGGSSGTTTVTGFGGPSLGGGNHGVSVTDAGSQITSSGGAVEVTGTGGGIETSGNNRGVSVRTGSVISSTKNGTVTVTGTAGLGSADSNSGISLTGQITSEGGAVVVTGTAGGTGASQGNRGVSVQGGVISGGNGGTVTVTGSGGSASGSFNVGVLFGGGGSQITSNGGAVLITGRGGSGSGSSNTGVQIGDVGSITTTNADLEIVGIVQGSGEGSDAITVSGNEVIAVDGTTGHLTLRGTSNLTTNSRSLVVSGNSRVTARGGDTGARLGLSDNATLDIVLQPTLGARAIEVDGTVDLGGATLNVVANALNTIILDNDDTDAIANTFNGFPAGTVLTNFQGTGLDVRMTYVGVDGNDAVLELVPPASTAVSLTNGALLVEDVAGGDSDDALTITLDRSNSANPVVRITDPNLQLGITGTIVGATLSSDGHTVTVPYNAVSSLHVLALGGNDKLTLAAAGSGAFQHEVLIDAGTGNDTVTLDSSLRGRFEGTLTANGNDGNDTLTAVAITGAGSFRVTFTGGNGDDTLTGGDKNDTLNAGLGNDVLYGLGGADSLDGGAGDDSLDGGASNDTLNGGTGIDRARRKNDVNFVVTNSELQELNGSTLISTDTLSGIEAITLIGGVSANRFDLTAFTNIAVAIVEGGGGNDTVLGTDGRDSITTGSGIDVIDGRGGNDTIASGDGADVVQGGVGNDSISGEGGNDSLVGGTGADFLFGGSGKDTLTGNEGNDTLNGGIGSDMLSEAGDVNFVLTNSSLTGLGTDQISAFEAALLIGGNGPNIIDASAATFSVLLNGGAGADILTGGSVSDSLNGGTGNDTLYGLGGQDLLFGSFGNDLLDGGASNDSLVGGDGIDAARRKNNTDFRVDNTGMFELLGTQVIATDTFNSIETISITGGVSANRIDLSAFTNTGTATIQGSGGNDTVIGSDGLDVITTTSGADVIDGRGGADTILSGDGADSIHGGDGNDNLDGQSGNDTVLGDAGNDNLGGGAGSDQIDGGAGRNRLVENVEGNVTIVGTQLTSSVLGNNDSIQNVIAIMLRGGTGNNLLDARLSSVPVQLQGNDGDDTLLGSSGRDLLQGGAGDDVLSGGDSIDTIDGGLGTDTFFESGNSDFAVTGVKIARGGGTTTESVSNIEGIVLIGGVGNNTLDASRASVPVTLLGGAGNDILAGGPLADVLIGGNRASSTNGLDTLNGLAGNDQFDNDPADTRTTDAGDQVLANIFAQLPAWIDAL